MQMFIPGRMDLDEIGLVLDMTMNGEVITMYRNYALVAMKEIK